MISSTARFPILATRRTCTGCMACVAVCSQKAISPVIDIEGHIAVTINTEKCIRCFRCEKMCIDNKKDYGTSQLDESKVYCGWAQNTQQRKGGTSGGVFAALAESILKNKGIVFGARFDGRQCAHISIENVADIPKLQTSKYVQSSIINVYREIDEELSYRKVLFTGTGCQVAAILEYFKDNKYKDNLYTIDIVCGGVPSGILVEKYLENEPEIEGIAAFRNKDKYELSVFKKGAVIPIREKSLPLEGYAYGMTNRYCCYDCQFAHPHRKSDITIGDFWNYSMYPEEHARGISIILVHSLRGKYLLDNSSIKMQTATWRDVLYTNPRIVYGKDRIYWPRKQLARNIQRLSYEEFVNLYCMRVSPWHVKEFLFKIYRHICYHRQRKEICHYIDKILSQGS